MPKHSVMTRQRLILSPCSEDEYPNQILLQLHSPDHRLVQVSRTERALGTANMYSLRSKNQNVTISTHFNVPRSSPRSQQVVVESVLSQRVSNIAGTTYNYKRWPCSPDLHRCYAALCSHTGSLGDGNNCTDDRREATSS